jgi:hypothetical protein
MPCLDAGVAGRPAALAAAAADDMMAVGGGAGYRPWSLGSRERCGGCGGKRGRGIRRGRVGLGTILVDVWSTVVSGLVPILLLSAEVDRFSQFSLPGVEPSRPLSPLALLLVSSSMHPAGEMVGRRLREDWMSVGNLPFMH